MLRGCGEKGLISCVCEMDLNGQHEVEAETQGGEHQEKDV